jgi:hypothetical protein
VTAVSCTTEQAYELGEGGGNAIQQSISLQRERNHDNSQMRDCVQCFCIDLFQFLYLKKKNPEGGGCLASPPYLVSAHISQIFKI